MLAGRLGSPMTSIMCVGAPVHRVSERLHIMTGEITVERLAENDLELS
jgi:hypothetical protein